MQRKHLTSWLSLAIIFALILGGCAPRAGAGETAAMAGTEQLAIDLPALLINFDEEGNPSLGNVPVAQLAEMAGQGMLDLSSLVLPPDTIQSLQQNNIQHIQVGNVPTGLLILVNGQPIPSLKWDGEILSATADTLATLGVEMEALDKLLPLLTHIGIGAIVKFPIAQGMEEIPTFIEGDNPAVIAMRDAQQAFLDNVGAPPQIKLPVIYDADGSWRVGDLTDAEWTNLTGIPIWTALRLNPDVISGLQQAGISEASIFTDERGIHLSLNGRELPYIGWADGELNHVLDLAGQMGLWNTLADSGMNMGEVVGMVETLLPVVQVAEASINVYFPKA